MSIPITYNYRADECPAIVVPTSLLNPEADPPASTTWSDITTGAVPGMAQKWNSNDCRGDVTGRWGGGGYARAYGLDLTDGGGLTGLIAAGQAMIDGPITKPLAVSVPLTNGVRNFQWLTQASAVPTVNYPDLSPPATRCAYLGSWLTAGNVITEIDYSGVPFLRGGTLWRRTADVAEPTDSPPANLQFFQRSLNGLYWWDGAQYWPVAAETLIRLAPRKISVPAAAMNYQIEADFSAFGEFADECLMVCCTCDERGPIISPETNRQTAGRASWIIYVPADSLPGSYGGILELELNVAIKGLGWTGASVISVSAQWTNPDPLT